MSVLQHFNCYTRLPFYKGYVDGELLDVRYTWKAPYLLKEAEQVNVQKPDWAELWHDFFFLRVNHTLSA